MLIIGHRALSVSAIAIINLSLLQSLVHFGEFSFVNTDG